MITVIAQKSTKREHWYSSIFNNIPSGSAGQLSLLIQILESKILTKIMLQKNYKEDDKVSKFNNKILIRYEDLDIDNFYIAFYDMILDSFWEKICEKKHPGIGFVWDTETPMLRFSKENFEHILNFWDTVKDNEPEYYIITQDDTGWIDVQAKNELSSDELRMVQEYKEYKEKKQEEEQKQVLKRDQNIN